MSWSSIYLCPNEVEQGMFIKLISDEPITFERIGNSTPKKFKQNDVFYVVSLSTTNWISNHRMLKTVLVHESGIGCIHWAPFYLAQQREIWLEVKWNEKTSFWDQARP